MATVRSTATSTNGRRSYANAVSPAKTSPSPISPPRALHPDVAEAERKEKYWQNRFSACNRELDALKDEVEQLVVRESRTEAKFANIRAAHDKLHQNYTALFQQHEGLQKKHAELKERAQGTVASLKAERKGCEESKASVVKLRAELEEGARELQHLRTKCGNMESLLEVRSAELRDAQTYLTKADTISYADVQRMVEGLNGQMFQLAALVSDGHAFSDNRVNAADIQAAYEYTERWIGQPAANLLVSTSHEDDPVWVQMGLQAVAAMFASWTIEAWDIRFDVGKNTLLTDIHGSLFQGEPQAVSARWRVLSRRYVKLLGTGHDAASNAMEQLLGAFRNILLICGAREALPTTNWAGIKEKVEEIIAESLRIQKAIGEDIASSDFQVICPHANTPFAAECMEDVDDCARTRGKKTLGGTPILCTTELGLRRCEKLAEEKGRPVHVHAVTLMKAKVALQDAAQVSL